MVHTRRSRPKPGGSTNKSVLGILFLVVYLSVWATIFFASAGRTDLPLAWWYFGLNLGLGLFFSLLLARMNPDLIGERMKPGPGEQDRVFKIASTILSVLLVVLAGLDVGHYHWTAPVTSAAQITALVLVLLGYALLSWALLINRFFSSAVRLQPDRRQSVVDKGPYAYVRHPGYAGALPYMVLTGLALGSWLSTLVAAIPLVFLFIRRTLLEDAMLCKGLPGYEEYARRVRYRLIPGIW
jgi:protein-S-isoprenylcysteine O-methyltransferase Ste14